MKVTYNPQLDILRIVFSEEPIAESDEDRPGVILDYSDAGHIVGIEILDASQHTINPAGIEYTIVGVKAS